MRPMAAYTISVLSAAVCLSVVSNWDTLRYIWESPVLFLLEIMVSIVSVAVVTSIPFAFVRRHAPRRSPKTFFWYIPLGLVLGLFGNILLAMWSSSSLPANDPERLHFWAGVQRFAPWFTSAGFVGGLTFWIALKPASAFTGDYGGDTLR